MNNTDTLFVGFCHRPEVADGFLYSMLATVRDPRVVQYKGFRSGPSIDYVRNLIVRRFLDGDATRLLMVDTDMAWTQDDLDTICDLADYGDRQIVSGWYNRQLGNTVVPICTRDGQYVTAGQGVQPVHTTGCGFLLIHRDVFANIAFPWFKTEWEGEQVRSEDVTFCDKARAAGYAVWVDTDTHIGHVKSVTI